LCEIVGIFYGLFCGDTGPLTIKRKKSVIKLKPSPPGSCSHEALPFVEAAAKAKVAGRIETQAGGHLAALTAFCIVAGRYFLMDMQPTQPFFTFSCFQPLTVHAKNGANLI